MANPGQGIRRKKRAWAYIVRSDDGQAEETFNDPTVVGRKAVGLNSLPRAWCPPYAAITTDVYAQWKRSAAKGRAALLASLGEMVSEVAQPWAAAFPRGIILRSSAESETLRERGMLESYALPADFNAESISSALGKIYTSALEKLGQGSVAVIAQPLVSGRLGHLSNERRVSKTRNHWTWEQDRGVHYSGRFNSQRAVPPNKKSKLVVQHDDDLISMFRSVGRWCTKLEKGPVHLEWSWTGDTLWLLQLDFEDDSPDDGVNPRELIRDADGLPSEPCGESGPLRELDVAGSSIGWAKLDMVRQLANARSHPFPRLYWIDGARMCADGFDWAGLESEIQRVTHGRAVCRTSCNAEGIPMLNLPRTDSVNPKAAVEFIRNTLGLLEGKGASPKSICFIMHKFIPAQSAAWAMAAPSSQIVKVDALWGVPDGLQYLPHDSFEYDVTRGRVSSERLRYKPAYIQEMETGEWKEIKIARKLARHRSLSLADLAEVATVTKTIADNAGRAVQVMWFCGIASSVGIGANLPWFFMDAPTVKKTKTERASPQRPRVAVKNVEDMDGLIANPRGNAVLVLEPEVDLIRSDDFLERVIKYARENAVPVELHGSTLGHAYYQLERAGLTVFLTDEPRYARTRGRRVFGKLVRDSIPTKIQQHGEQVRLARIGRSEARAALLVKIMEEVQELRAASSPQDVLAELADVHEVVRALCAATGIDWADVERIAEEKRQQRGSFQGNVVLLETSWPAGMQREESEPRRIPLKALANITLDGQSAQLSYAALFAQGADPTVELPSGVKIRATLNEGGLRLEEVEPEIDSASQLELPFGKPSAR